MAQAMPLLTPAFRADPWTHGSGRFPAHRTEPLTRWQTHLFRFTG